MAPVVFQAGSQGVIGRDLIIEAWSNLDVNSRIRHCMAKDNGLIVGVERCERIHDTALVDIAPLGIEEK